MIGYRNISYIPRTKEVKVWTWDAQGNRTSYTQPYRPYVYVEDKNGDEISIYRTKVRKKTFNNQYERTRFVRDTGIRRLFENLPTYQQFLIDEYWQYNELTEFSSMPLKVQFIDIEAVARDEFPDPEEALHPINVVTIYDTLEKHKHVWGVGEFDSSKYDPSELTYYNCKTEVELIDKMLTFLEADYPDIISGWNSAGFDIPYVINRIHNVMGEDHVRRLSPTGNVYNKAIRGAFGKHSVRWFIDGISCLDYLDVYKRFQLKNRDSYKLDNIAQIEIGEKKIEYGNMHIADLCAQDWQTFVEYNIHDVFLLQRLDEELRYMELIRMLAYVGLTTFEAAMGAVAVINGAATIRARDRNQKIATFVRHEDSGKNPGAFVGEPLEGFQQYVVSFDANSLYPNLMISLNMSPETKVGKIISHDSSKVVVRYVNGETFDLTPAQFGQLVKKESLAISKAGILFSQKTKGIMPDMVDFYYNKRVEVKDDLRKATLELVSLQDKTDINSEKRKQELKFTINRLDTKQLTIKVLINSAYGYFGNKHSPIGDDDIASSITLSGQAVIKQSNVLAKNYLKEKTNISDDYLKHNDPVVYNDTDSFLGDTEVLTESGKISVEDLWNKNISNIELSNYSHEMKECDLPIYTYDEDLNLDQFKRAKRIFRHKVKKRMFKIKTSDGKEVTITEDHGLMVMRNNKLTRISPLEKLPADRVITTMFD